jgi:REP element-mobilizing transposase RayT
MAAHQLYFHLAWTTLERRPMIDAGTRDFLNDFLRRTAIRERAVAIAILQTHVHVLVRSGPRVDLSRLVQLMKGGSSYAAGRLPGNRLGLRWAKEYSATTVSPKSLARALEYFAVQEEHHSGEGIPR